MPSLAEPPLLMPGSFSHSMGEEFAGKQLYQQTQSITVKVLSGQSNGSGILIQRRGPVYTVLTNRHVLDSGDSYRIQTNDGTIYPASASATGRFPRHDLALLQFCSSQRDYTLATLGNSSTLAVDDRVFAAGFPSINEGFEVPLGASRAGFSLNEGRIVLILEESLVDGYQIGYTNDIRKGMSGGPLLNSQGEVVGINGMHAYPLWGDPYIYQNRSQPPLSLRQQMKRYSWGIPIDSFIELAGDLVSRNKLLPSANFIDSSPRLSSQCNVSYGTEKSSRLQRK